MEKMHLLTSALVLIFFYLEVESSPHRGATAILLEKQTYCGRSLADTLQLVCNGMYNSMYKRSQEEDWEVDDYPFRRRHLAKALLPGTFRRNTRGIVDECCKKSCFISEMSSYCGGK